MPNQRAPGPTVRSIPMPSKLWAAVTARADADGVSRPVVVRAALAEYLGINREDEGA